MPIQFPDGDSFIIRDVWSSNVDQEFAIIRGIVDKFPYIAMDTEFPGIIVSHVGGTPDVNYKTLRSNVNPLKLIQLGLTFSDEHGNHPTVTVTDDSSSSSSSSGSSSSGSSKKKNQGEKFCVWQFNFREFNVKSDVYAPDSIQLLIKSGIDFKRNMRDGIDVRRFGELLSASGAVRNDRIHWVTFHSAYDFGYLLKLLKGEDLPETKEGFFELMNLYFPRVYDMKYLMRFCNNLFGGLDKLAELLEVRRIGVRHLAGSDSLLTCHSFLRMKEKYFSDSLVQYRGVLFGLGSGASGTDASGGGASGGGSSTGGASGGGGSSGGASSH